MSILLLVAGIVVIVAAIVGVIVSRLTTPPNLRGFYSLKYIMIAAVAVVAGAIMIVVSFFV